MRGVRRFVRILLNAVTVASLLVSLAAAILWLRSHYVWNNVPLGSRFRIVSCEGTLSLDNHPEHAAYRAISARFSFRGGTVRLRPLSPPRTPAEQVVWGYAPPPPPQVPPAPPDVRWSINYATLAGLGMLLFVAARIATPTPRPSRFANLCPACGYDLRATPDRCPECGTPPPAPAPVRSQ
jgi:hypothetical protein